MTWTGPIRVASIPAAHPYVQHLAAPGRPDTVTRLPDPRPDVDDPMPGQWWPPAMLTPGWITRHHAEFDLAHLHFGFDAAEPVALQQWVDELSDRQRPLVFTVHDLVNPHFVDQRQHGEQLDVLVPAAAAVITLTPGAAAVIKERWDRDAVVIPHPHVVPLDSIPPTLGTPGFGTPGFGTVQTAGMDREGLVIGVHAKSLRANIDPLAVLVALDQVARTLPGTIVRVDVHPDVLQRTDPAAVAMTEWLRTKENDPVFRVEVHARFTDDELWNYLASLDLCVLPYRFGTHSGWLEACVDVGTGALVPATGFYSEQHGHPSYRRLPTGEVDQQAFAEVLGRIHRDRSIAVPPRPDRVRQRQQIAEAHQRLYRRVLTGRFSR